MSMAGLIRTSLVSQSNRNITRIASWHSNTELITDEVVVLNNEQ